MNENYSRLNLITKFNCTDCGGSLALSYNLKDGVKVKDTYSPNEPTGAAMVAQHVYIEPCTKCVGDAQKPLKQIRDALGSILKD